MKLNQDQLVQGPFGSNACYEQSFEQEGTHIKTWLCFGSGFTTSTLMTEGSKVVNDLLATSPELVVTKMNGVGQLLRQFLLQKKIEKLSSFLKIKLIKWI